VVVFFPKELLLGAHAKTQTIRCTGTKNRFGIIQKYATCKQLRDLLGIKDRKLKRTTLLERVKCDTFVADVAKVSAISKQHLENQTRRCFAVTTRANVKRAWKYFSQFVQTGVMTFAKIKPCVFYDWKSAWSGPGQTLVRSFGEQKSKMCKIRFETNLTTKDDSNRHVRVIRQSVQVSRLQHIKLEYLLPPQNPNVTSIVWETWALQPTAPGTSLTSIRGVRRDLQQDEYDNYVFTCFGDERMHKLFVVKPK
jgi:hypothetical protein